MYHVLQDLQCIYVFILGAFFVMTSSIMEPLTRSVYVQDMLMLTSGKEKAVKLLTIYSEYQIG